MRHTILLALLAGSLVAAGPELPRKATEFAVQTAPQKYTWLNQYAGKTVVMAFILTDCSHCQFTTGILNNIQKDYAARGVQVIESAIDSMSALKIPDFQKKFKPAFPVGYNEQGYAAKFMGYPETEPMFMPQIAIIDKTGTIRAQFSGDDPGLETAIQDATLRVALDKALGDRPAAVPSAPPAKKAQ